MSAMACVTHDPPEEAAQQCAGLVKSLKIFLRLERNQPAHKVRAHIKKIDTECLGLQACANFSQHCSDAFF